MQGAKSKERSPGKGYERQIRAYAVLLKHQYKIKVKGLMLVFIPRDNPSPTSLAIWEHVLTDKDFKDGKLELKADRELHRRAMEAKTVEQVMALAKTRCGSQYCEYCKLDTTAFRKIANQVVDKLPIMK